MEMEEIESLKAKVEFLEKTIVELYAKVSAFGTEVVAAVKDEGETIEENFKDFAGIEENCKETKPEAGP
jgi:hypothetical protein